MVAPDLKVGDVGFVGGDRVGRHGRFDVVGDLLAVCWVEPVGCLDGCGVDGNGWGDRGWFRGVFHPKTLAEDCAR